MKNNYSSVETVFEYLESIGALGPITSALLALLATGGVLLLCVWLYLSYGKFRMRGGLSGARTRRKTSALRASGQVEGKFTFADAIEMTETGTVRRKALEDKMVNCVVPVEMLFDSDDHGLYYQFEMGEWSAQQVASWAEVAKALNLPDISKILEEAVVMWDIICHPDYDPSVTQGDEEVHRILWKRASDMCVTMKAIDGIARLRAACEAHLRKNAPEMLPLPTW